MAERSNFGKLQDVLNIPDLIAVQLESYAAFLQKEAPPEKRKNQGLQEVFKEVFPLESFDKQLTLDFTNYTIGDAKRSVLDCIKDGDTYSAPLHVAFKIDDKGKKIEELVYFGDIPMMTDRGTFVINGAERVIISQLHRSPGICFEKSRHSNGRTLYSYRIIPDRGSWMEVQYDINDLIYIYLDRRRRRRKFLITTLLRAIGYETNADILAAIYKVDSFSTASLLKKDAKELACYYTVKDVTDSSGAVIVNELEPLTEALLKTISDADVKKVDLAEIPDGVNHIILCLKRDPSRNTEEALKEVYKRMRPGDPPSISNAKQLLKRLFFDVRRYDLGEVGRFKINQKLGTQTPITVRILDKNDLMEATKYLIKLRNTGGQADDIDHLGSRRVRTVGELLQNQCRVGLVRTERLIRERMTLLGTDGMSITPGQLVNPKAFAGVVRDFFARNQLSQFMDQTNPLSELTNKRRLSALGPGGLSRERAGFEVRDVHSSHYGRVCPIETPEGPNIGLISSMSLYARINRYGFLETPYRIVKHGVATKEIDYLTADQEERFVIAQANATIDEKGKLLNEMVMCRYQGDSAERARDTIQYMDVSPKQLVSAAAGLIPFLEHDDANRALMGSNMQRQAVPLMTTEAPLVGTGLEHRVAADSRAVMSAEKEGIVASVTGNLVIVSPDGKMPKSEKDEKAQFYILKKYLRSNAGTCINQRPSVKPGQKIKKGDVIADGAATANGELALGKNVFVAFMPWCGYNFEDAIVINERIVKEDVFTSIHIDEFELTARDTKLGPEEITRDIPNVSEEALRNLGPDGIVRLGAEVKSGDILVGKITPKSETELAPEERLLRAIFGEKAADVKDSSLIVSSGKGGIVMDVRIERSKDPNRQSLTKSEIRRQTKLAKDNFKNEYNEIVEELADRLAEIMLGQKLPCPIYDSSSSKHNAILISANRKVTRSSVLKLANKHQHYKMDSCPLRKTIDGIIDTFVPRFKEIEASRDEILKSLEKGEGVDPGIVKKVKVYVASKRKLEVGDKMAGRHGNKGIVAKIVPEEDMPFLADGTPVDIVLNPLGVPSRMNVGQVLETHLGWAAKILGLQVASPVFDGVSEEKIVELMKKANEKLPKEKGESYTLGFKHEGSKYVFDGKTDLYDGRSGEKFAQRVLVGQIYMMKLDHLVSNKIHARAVGPYSLVTQQPLGGKAQHGGQRFGEMEVWALEAYGAAYTLQEMLTVKSDDVVGRARIYESIVKGHNVLEPHRPESFNVLLKELQSLGIDIRITNKQSLTE
ncbi:MAG TPA: DNA-directed RNA polymerase subunit beta [Lentisphaeria bacterium]|nr:MAG: DNA-directed RNA polymerase subunit beta [Lentisphaerae bacterium GWF2_50_93]HCE44181.1 DNA-directed RNA polymerase subunit beta [Lentisphaeria bacterium]